MLTLKIHKRVLSVFHNLTQRTMKFFQNLLCSWTPWVLLSRPQLVRNHFLVSLPKKKQDDMLQPFVHFRWSLKRQSSDYKWKGETFYVVLLQKQAIGQLFVEDIYIFPITLCRKRARRIKDLFVFSFMVINVRSLWLTS